MIARVLDVGPPDDRHDLLHPLAVFIAVDETGSFIARALAFAVHGDGETLLDAEADLRACPAEYYDLVEEGTRLPDPYDQREIERLHAWIVARP